MTKILPEFFYTFLKAEPLKKTKLKLGGRSCLLIPGGFNTGGCIYLIISKIAVFAKNLPASHVHVAIQPL